MGEGGEGGAATEGIKDELDGEGPGEREREERRAGIVLGEGEVDEGRKRRGSGVDEGKFVTRVAGSTRFSR